MKAKLLFWGVVLLSVLAQAQTTAIPDANFENYLETHNATGTVVALGDPTSMGDGIANNNLVLTSRINSVTSLNVSNQSISDLTGIANFSALEELNCSDNSLTALDITQNTALKILDYSNYDGASPYNIFTTLDLTQNTNLEKLTIQGVWFENGIDLSSNTNLKELNISKNPRLTALNVSSNTALETLIINDNKLTALDITQNTALKTLDYSNYDGASPYNIFTILNLTQNTNLEVLKLQSVWFENGIDLSSNTNIKEFNNFNNPKLTTIDVTNNLILETLNVSRCDLSTIDVTKNTSLETLMVADNKMTGLDVTQNTALTYLDYSNWDQTAPYNTMATLDVTQNINLESLFLGSLWLQNTPDLSNNTNLKHFRNESNPNLTTINVANNTALESLILTRCALTNVDVSNNLNLKQLYLSRNSLTGSLDLSNHNLLEQFAINNNDITSLNIKNTNNTALTLFYTNENPNLTCVQVDNMSYAYGKAAEEGGSWGKDMATQYQEDCSNPNTATVYVPDDNLEQALIDAGITASTALDNYILLSEALNVQWGLDLRNKGISDPTGIESMVNLRGMNIAENNLTTINLSQNTKLDYLDVANNKLSVLNLSNNPLVKSLHCGLNNLTGLDVSHLNLTQLSISKNNIATVDLSKSTNLTHIWASEMPSLSTIDLSTSLNLEYVNFNHTSNIGNLNLTTEHTKLKEVHIENTGATQINVSGAIDLVEFNCGRNALSNIDVSNNINLEKFWCDNNTNITALDLSTNTKLIRLGAAECSIANINLSNVTELQYLDLYKNNLTSLDVSNSTKLIEFNIPENNITGTLDLSAHNQLTKVVFGGNDITKVNLKNGANTSIAEFNSLNNPNLTCIQVDDETYANANFTNKDAWTSFNITCVNLSTEDIFLNENLSLYPNPTKAVLHIKTQNNIEILKVELHNVLGQKVLQTKQNKINTSALDKGVYFVKIRTNKGKITKKIIKE